MSFVVCCSEYEVRIGTIQMQAEIRPKYSEHEKKHWNGFTEKEANTICIHLNVLFLFRAPPHHTIVCILFCMIYIVAHNVHKFTHTNSCYI